VLAKNDLRRIDVKALRRLRAVLDGTRRKASRKDRARELAAALLLHPERTARRRARRDDVRRPRRQRMRANCIPPAWALRKQIGSLAVQYAPGHISSSGPATGATSGISTQALARSRGAIGNPYQG